MNTEHSCVWGGFQPLLLVATEWEMRRVLLMSDETNTAALWRWWQPCREGSDLKKRNYRRVEERLREEWVRRIERRTCERDWDWERNDGWESERDWDWEIETKRLREERVREIERGTVVSNSIRVFLKIFLFIFYNFFKN